MKSNAAAASTSEITETTITKRTLPPQTPAQGRTAPEFWPYIEGLKSEDWEEHTVYLYRIEPRATSYSDQPSSLEKIVAGTMEVRPGVTIPFNNREDIELAVREKHGGRSFRLICKRRSERVCEGKIVNDAPPKYQQQQGDNHSNTSPTVQPISDAGATADIAKTAMSTVAGQERAAVEVGISALRGAAEVMQRFAKSDQQSANPVTDQILQILISRALAPPPDPLELITRLMTVMKTFTPESHPSATTGQSPLLDKLLDTALERLLNPVASGPAVSAGAELVRQLPSVAGYVVQAMEAWRHGSEAQRDTASIMAGRGQVTPPQPGAPVAAPAPRTLTAPPIAPPPTAARPEDNMGTVEFLENKIVGIMRKPELSAEEAADDVLAFLDVLDPSLIKQLSSLGEAGLVNLFQTRPILHPMTGNMPRLIEFIRAFLKFSAGEQAPPAAPDTKGDPNGVQG